MIILCVPPQAFIEYGTKKNRIFCDKKSGKDFERENYQRLLKKLKAEIY